jgi:hypothetical protein
VWEKLSAAFPPLEQAASLPGPTSPAVLPEWLGSAVGLHADLGEFFPPSGKERRVLIHIQDLHDVEEAQRNTAAVLEQLAKSLGGKQGLPVGVEGASGGFRTDDFRALASPRALQRTANRFLKAGFISGPEYFSLTTETSVRLWGAEDARAYAANIASLTDSFAGQAKDDARVSEGRRLVHRLKTHFYPPALKELDDLRARYAEGRLGLASYARSLADGASTEIGPNLRLFLSAVAEEEDLPASRVEEDQKRFLEALAPRLSEPEIHQLMEAGLAHRLGRAPYARFHAALKDLAGRHGLSLNDYPGLTAYAAYAAKADGLNRAALWREIDALVEERFQALLTSPDLEELASVDADLRLIEKLNGFSLSADDFKRMLERRDALRLWSERGESLSHRVPSRLGAWPNLSPVMDRHEGFYRWAEERNAPLVNNLLARWTGGGPAVLVAGGYHAEGIRAAAVSRGLGYISLIPRVTATQEFPGSLDSFRNPQWSLEWFSRGERVGLHQPLLTAAQPDASAAGRTDEFQRVFCFQALLDQAGEFGAVSLKEAQRAVKQTIQAARRFGLELSLTAPIRVDRPPSGERRLALSFSAKKSGSRTGAEDLRFETWVALPALGPGAIGNDGDGVAQSVRGGKIGPDLAPRIRSFFSSLWEGF